MFLLLPKDLTIIFYLLCYAAGYVKQSQGKWKSKPGKGGGYGRGGGKRNQGQDFKRRLNPAGPDGKTLICKACGSYRHLMWECPDSWENLRKVHVVEDENVVLFTGYNKARYIS